MFSVLRESFLLQAIFEYTKIIDEELCLNCILITPVCYTKKYVKATYGSFTSRQIILQIKVNMKTNYELLMTPICFQN